MEFYLKQEIPTLDKIHEQVKNKLSYSGNRETLRRVLEKTGFYYAKVEGRKLLLERNVVQFERCMFLREIGKHLSTGKNIVYFDDTCMGEPEQHGFLMLSE